MCVEWREEKRRQKAEGRGQINRSTAYCLLLLIAVPDLFLRALLPALDPGAAGKFFRITGRGFLDYSAFVCGNFRERSFG